jgi:hypothetical protein
MKTDSTIYSHCLAMKLADATSKLIWMNALSKSITSPQSIAKDGRHKEVSIVVFGAYGLSDERS